MNHSIIINLIGGPSCGKSTLASELFAMMKKKGFSVELTQEFPKVLAWDGNIESIKDQFYVTANQHRNISRLYGKVEYIIVDSPILLGLVYKNIYDSFSNYPSEFYDDNFDNFIISLFKKYKNINIYLKRIENIYENFGRYQDYNESLSIDEKIKELLIFYNLPFDEFDISNHSCQDILKHIINYGH
jgi:hypothetical protein